MKRRDFGKALVGSAVGAGLSTLIPGTKLAVGQHVPDYGRLKPVTPKKNLKMHVGSDYHVIEGPSIFSKENLEYNVRFGVKSMSPDPDLEAHRGNPRPSGSAGGDFIPIEGPVEGGAFDLDLLKKLKDNCDAAGIWLEGLRMDSGYIILKQKPDQDKKIDQISENIRKAAQVDVHLISQHWTMIPIRRNGTAPGRGGAVYTTFKLENDWRSLPEGVAGHVSYNEYWNASSTSSRGSSPSARSTKSRWPTILTTLRAFPMAMREWKTSTRPRSMTHTRGMRTSSTAHGTVSNWTWV